MRLITKVAMGASAITLAAALASVMESTSINVSAETKTSSPIDNRNLYIDFSEKVMTVSTGYNKRIYVSFPSVNKNNVLSQDKNISVYETNDSTVYINLTTLKGTKDNYIKIWGDVDQDSFVVKIPKAPVLKNATVNNLGNTIEVTPKTGTVKNNQLEYSMGYNWEYLFDEDEDNTAALSIDFNDYNQLGASLKIHVAGTNAKTNSGFELDSISAGTISDIAGKKYDYYELKDSYFASNEIKAKIAKKAAAPKVIVDYVNAKVTVPRNVEYRSTFAGTAAGDKWTGVSSNKFELKFGSEDGQFNIDTEKPLIVDFRRKANTTTKKPASKYKSLTFVKRAELSSKETTDKNSDSATVYIKKDKSEEEVVLTTTNKVTNAVKNGIGKNATKASIEIENKTSATHNFQYVVKDSPTEPTSTDNVKLVENKKVIVNLDATKNQYLYVRRVSKGKSTDFSTKWIDIVQYNNTDNTFKIIKH